MPKKFLRKQAVAERYSIDERTVDRMKDDGRLPEPHYRGRWPTLGRRRTGRQRPRRCAFPGQHTPALHENGRPFARAAERESYGTMTAPS